nr:PREDICTED: uncharacterized protein LOC105675720 isoform X2 [Linepithema humile]
MDRFNSFSKYNQQKPPYKSSLTAISMHECPVSKMQVSFFTPRILREKRRSTKIRVSNIGDQQQLKSDGLNYFQRNNRSVKWHLEDEIALAKHIFWTEKQRVHKKASNMAFIIARKKFNHMKNLLDLKYPRWYQDFSLDQIKNLMNLENVIHADYKERITNGTQTTLMAIGITSTFFKLNPNIIKELHKSSGLNSVDFLREIYKILTGNDFYEEKYKKFYNCNERIILSAIAFLTLPETVKELHRRLPAVIMPKLPLKPKPVYLERRRSSCPYNEELFKRFDWAAYRNSLEKWRKQCKLLTIPKVILPFKEQDHLFVSNKILSRITKREKNNATEYLEEIRAKLQKISATKFNQTSKHDNLDIDKQVKYKDEDFLGEKNLETGESTFDIYQLDDDKKFDFMIKDLHKKLEAVEYKASGVLKPLGASQKSWLGEKTALYTITGISEDHPPTYEITGVVYVTPTNSDERFFAVLQRDERFKKIFPSGRENLSKNWQEWLQNVDEEFNQVQEKADDLIKSVQTVTKFLKPICDSCCSCRQTRKTREKLRQTKTPHLLIDNVVQDEGKNKYSVTSIAMQSPGPSPTGSPINLLEENASQDEIKTNIIIDGVAYENGETQYYISGVQKEKIHIPSRVPSVPPVSQPIRNIPPCACAIQQMINKDASPSTSKDDIPWTKDEGLCPGKKYRPDEPGAYSCKMYPGDKSCRRNPFMKEIVQIKNKEKEKEEIEKRKEKAETVDVVKKEIQVPKKNVIEKKRFIPDPDYPAYDNPWDISRIAPSAETTVETDYETSLKLTSPTLPATSAPLRMHERQKDILSKELKEAKNDSLNKETNKKNPKISLKPSKNVQEKRNKKKGNLKNTKKRRNKSSKNITAKSESKLATKIFKSTRINKTKKNKQQTKSLYDFPYNSEESRKQEMARLKNMFKFPAGVLDDIQPVLPNELSEEQREETGNSLIDEEESRIEKRPCCWRTRSEQELPAKKTLAYLCEPDYPLETMPVRPGGRPCHCRENRSKKKILVSGVVEKKIDGMRVEEPNLEEENRVIDGVVYVTPSPSPRRSDEYVPEYDLLDSPYDMCIGETTDERLKLIEKYSGPKSLVKRIQKKPKSCNCTDDVKKDNQKNDIEEARRKLIESKSPEERWRVALKDAALMDHFTQREDNAPCWTSCKKFARSIRPRRLKVMKPVCECKNERKILERNEERAKWKARQQKLKALKKQPFMPIVDISRPMVKDTIFTLSEVKKNADDIEYHISDVAETVSMSSPQQAVDGLKMSTPLHTPEPSKEDILQAAVHRHWSPMNIPPGPLPRKDAALKAEIDRRKKARDEAFRLIYENKSEQVAPYATHQEIYDEEKLKEIEQSQKTKESHTSVTKEVSKAPKALHSLGKKISSKIEYEKDVLHKEISSKIIDEKKQYPEVTGEVYQRDNASYKQIIEKTREKIDDNTTGDGDKKLKDSKFNLRTIIKAELKKMDVEGYAFAKLPKCYLMPQLQDWIMYRKGIVFSETDKKKLMQKSVVTWQLLDKLRMPKFEVPSLNMTRHQLKSLSYSQAKEIKKKIEEKRAIFQSGVRKERVSYARSMWNTMEFGKFPSTLFKRAYFTYMPSKEADGHVYKPWLTSELCKPNPDFSCY